MPSGVVSGSSLPGMAERREAYMPKLDLSAHSKYTLNQGATPLDSRTL